MDKAPSLAILPPAGSNRLAKEIGRRLSLARRGRKLSQADAAKQLGLDLYLYIYLEKGRVLSSDAVYTRIRDWLLKGYTFEGQVTPKRSSSSWAPKESWPLLPPSRIPRQIRKELKLAAKRLGLTQAAIIHMALDHFLANKPALKTFESAVKKIQKARVSMALQQSPALRDILEAEIPLMIQAGKTLLAYDAVLVKEPAIEQVAAIPISRIDPTVVEVEEEWEI